MKQKAFWREGNRHCSECLKNAVISLLLNGEDKFLYVTYKAKVAVCSEVRKKHSKQSEHHVEFLNVKPGGT